MPHRHAAPCGKARTGPPLAAWSGGAAAVRARGLGGARCSGRRRADGRMRGRTGRGRWVKGRALGRRRPAPPPFLFVHLTAGCTSHIRPFRAACLTLGLVSRVTLRMNPNLPRRGPPTWIAPGATPHPYHPARRGDALEGAAARRGAGQCIAGRQTSAFCPPPPAPPARPGKNGTLTACAAAGGLCRTGAARPARHSLARNMPLGTPRSLFGAGVPSVPPRRAAAPSLAPPASSWGGAAGGSRRRPFVRASAVANRPCDCAGSALCIHWQWACRTGMHPAWAACPAMRPAARRATAAILPLAARRGGDGAGRDMARRTAIAPPGMPAMRD